MVIEPKGLWEHSAYQTDNRFILEVKPVSRGSEQARPGRAGWATRARSFRSTSRTSKCAPCCRSSPISPGLNIITSDTVQRQPDAAPEGHPVGSGARHHHADQGPRHAQERQCRADRAARGARPQGEAAARERDADQRARAARDPSRSSSTTSRRRTSSAICHDEPAAAIRRRCGADGHHGRPGLDPLRSAASRSSIRASNILFVQDTASRLEEVRKIIRQIDTPIRQVLIEARIVIAKRQVQQAARRALRRADGLHVQQPVCGGSGRQPQTRSRSCTLQGDGADRRATRGRRRRSSSHRASLSPATPTTPQLNVNSAGHRARRASSR